MFAISAIPLPVALGAVLASAAGAAPDAVPPANSLSNPAPSACQARLSERAVFKALGDLAEPGRGASGCGATDAVLLQRVILEDRSEVKVEPPATLRCEMAEAVAEFVRSGIAPAATAMGASLSAIGNHDSYECRGRNRIPGARLSEHGLANALDIRSITLADGRVVMPADAAAPPGFRAAMKAAACDRFTTVLGPGSDGYHEDHVHIDRIERHSGYRLCRWELADEPRYALQSVAGAAAPFGGPIPLPRPRPSTVAHAPAAGR